MQRVCVFLGIKCIYLCEKLLYMIKNTQQSFSETTRVNATMVVMFSVFAHFIVTNLLGCRGIFFKLTVFKIKSKEYKHN